MMFTQVDQVIFLSGIYVLCCLWPRKKISTKDVILLAFLGLVLFFPGDGYPKFAFAFACLIFLFAVGFYSGWSGCGIVFLALGFLLSLAYLFRNVDKSNYLEILFFLLIFCFAFFERMCHIWKWSRFPSVVDEHVKKCMMFYLMLWAFLPMLELKMGF